MFTKEVIHEFVRANQQEAIDCLVELLQTPSTTGDEVAVSKVFAGRLKEAGFDTQIIGPSPAHPNVIAAWHGSQPGKKFQFNGHMDTFPPTEGDPGL